MSRVRAYGSRPAWPGIRARSVDIVTAAGGFHVFTTRLGTVRRQNRRAAARKHTLCPCNVTAHTPCPRVHRLRSIRRVGRPLCEMCPVKFGSQTRGTSALFTGRRTRGHTIRSGVLIFTGRTGETNNAVGSPSSNNGHPPVPYRVTTRGDTVQTRNNAIGTPRT